MIPHREREAATLLPAPLLRLHRHSRANLLVLGGTQARRLAVARAFHRRSPLAGEPMSAIDCEREEARLVRALERWLLACAAPEPQPDDPRERVRVLYLDRVSALSGVAQRLLLMVAHRMHGDADTGRSPGPARLMAGDRHDLLRATETGRFSAALADLLDKIRVDLGRRRSRGAA